jgi:hypothetical protein
MFLMMMTTATTTTTIIIIIIIITCNIFGIDDKEMCSLDNYSMCDLCTRQAGQPMS